MVSIELASPGVDPLGKGTETPDIEDAAEASPAREVFLSSMADEGRRSGKRVLASVTMSEGDKTTNGWTSTVSRGEVIAFAGKRTGLAAERRCLKRETMLSMHVRTSGRAGTAFFLDFISGLRAGF